jgi:hypothetical protein
MAAGSDYDELSSILAQAVGHRCGLSTRRVIPPSTTPHQFPHQMPSGSYKRQRRWKLDPGGYDRATHIRGSPPQRSEINGGTFLINQLRAKQFP